MLPSHPFLCCFFLILIRAGPTTIIPVKGHVFLLCNLLPKLDLKVKSVHQLTLSGIESLQQHVDNITSSLTWSFGGRSEISGSLVTLLTHSLGPELGENLVRTCRMIIHDSLDYLCV